MDTVLHSRTRRPRRAIAQRGNMRVTYWMCAVSSLFGFAACNKSKDQGPESATTQMNKVEPVAPETPTTPSEPDRDRELPTAAERRGPADRAEAIQLTLKEMERGEFRQAFKYLDEDIVWTEVGLPDSELNTIDEVVGYHQKSRTGYSDFRLRAKRIMAAADYQVVEFVWSARHSGAFADGTPATDKVVTLPGAMMLRYQADGLIDRVWVFQDWPNALKQLGLSPGLPSDFKPFPFPEQTALIAGPYNEAFKERYQGFATRLGPNDLDATLAERVADDFAWFDFETNLMVSGREATKDYLARRAMSFMPVSTTIEASIGTGMFYAAYVTNELVYKGGFMDVVGSDQKITTHTLDIVEFEPEKLSFKTLARYGNSYEILAGLNLNAAAGAPIEAKDERFGLKACDNYVTHMRTCIESQDAAKQVELRGALDVQIVRWQADQKDTAVRGNVMRSCEDAHTTAKQAMAASCPRVTWD